MAITILIFILMFLWYLGRGYQKTGNWGESLTYASGHVIEAYVIGFAALLLLLIVLIWLGA